MDKLYKASIILKLENEQFDLINEQYARGEIDARQALDLTEAVIKMTTKLYKQAMSDPEQENMYQATIVN
jgi:hypothetical protein